MPASTMQSSPSETRAPFAPGALPAANRRFREYAAHEIRAPRSRRMRRRARLIRFLILESLALLCLAASAAISRAEALLAPSNNSLCVGMLVISAAAVVAVPVWFYGLPGQRLRS